MLVAPAPPPGSKDSSAAVQNHRRLAGHWPRRPTLENSRLDSGGQGGRKLLTISHTSYSQGNYEAQFWRVGIHTFTVFDDITHLPPIRQYRYSLDNYEVQFGRSCSLDTLSLQYLGESSMANICTRNIGDRKLSTLFHTSYSQSHESMETGQL